MNITEKDVIAIAKRDNNKKRTFLLIDPLQGKHLPVSPASTYQLLKMLADKVFKNVSKENLLIIGFAETATAIGAVLAAYAPFDVTYMHTTREIIPGCDYLYFTESHSHATEQKLVKNTLDACLKKRTQIVFVEDEVTTGNTIENIIALLNKTYPDHDFTYHIASILNGMPLEKLAELKNRNIGFHYVLKVPKYDYETILADYSYEEHLNIDCRFFRDSIPSKSITIGTYQNARTGVSIKSYQNACDDLAKQALSQIPQGELLHKSILVLGTEECMYPGLHFAKHLEDKALCKSVSFHATTRSPILPSASPRYPLHHRYTLNSFYDASRTTYLYNLTIYDYVIIVTDAPKTGAGILSLSQALSQNNCKNILSIYWR